jgi:hypothetical protein
MRKEAVKEDSLRTLGIRLLRIPNGMVREHPDEFVRTVVDAMGATLDKTNDIEELETRPRGRPRRRRAAAVQGASRRPCSLRPSYLRAMRTDF